MRLPGDNTALQKVKRPNIIQCLLDANHVQRFLGLNILVTSKTFSQIHTGKKEAIGKTMWGYVNIRSNSYNHIPLDERISPQATSSETHAIPQIGEINSRPRHK